MGRVREYEEEQASVVGKPAGKGMNLDRRPGGHMTWSSIPSQIVLGRLEA